MRLYHGGVPGLVAGDLLRAGERHYVDGCAICAEKQAGRNPVVGGVVVDPINAHEDRVYVTSDREYARFYASKYPTGDLYSVEPVGELLDVGSEDPFPTWAVVEARVTGVVSRAVRLSSQQRRTLERKWRAVDESNGARTFRLAMPYPNPGAGRMHG